MRGWRGAPCARAQHFRPDAVRVLRGGWRRAGLTVALDLLKEIADKYEGVSYADLFQLASATAIEVRGAAAALYHLVALLARASTYFRTRPRLVTGHGPVAPAVRALS